MTPWKYTKYLHEIKDYENLEYRSEMYVNRILMEEKTQKATQLDNTSPKYSVLI